MKSSHYAIGAILLALAGLWYAAGGSQSDSLRAAESVGVSSPIAHDNLTVYFIHGPDQIDDSKVITLQQALECKCAVIHETGNVNTLVIENLSPDQELFVQSGDMIKGGRQDRLIATDMLLPPGSGKVSFPAHCVEHGRWTGRQGEQATLFTKSDNFVCGNGTKLANFNRDQGQVWANVSLNQANLTTNLGTTVASPTSPTSLQLSLENKTLQEKVAAFEADLRSAGEDQPGVVGVVFVVNGKVTGGEQYGSNGMFRKAWPKLLRSAAVEALAERPSAVASTAPTTREIERFLASSSQPERRKGGNSTVPQSGTADALSLTEGINTTTNTLILSGAGTVNLGNVSSSTSGGGSITYTGTAHGGLSASGVVNLGSGTHAGTSTVVTVDNVRAGQLMIGGPVNSNVGVNGNPVSRVLTTELEFPAGTVTRIGDPSDDTLGNRLSTPRPQPTTNRVTENRVDNSGTLMLESRDPARNNAVIHRSYLKK